MKVATRYSKVIPPSFVTNVKQFIYIDIQIVLEFIFLTGCVDFYFSMQDKHLWSQNR